MSEVQNDLGFEFPSPGRASRAFGNLARGDVGAAGRALYSPDSLSISESRKFSDVVLGDSNPLFKSIFEVVTNPMVLIGLALHVKFPVATAENLFKFSKEVSGFQRTFAPGLRHFQSFFELFRGHEVTKRYPTLLNDIRHFKEKHTLALTEAIERWQTASGKRFTTRDQIRAFAHMDGLDRPGSAVAKLLGNKELGFKPITDAPTKRLAKDIQKVQQSIWKEVLEPTGAKQNIGELRKELLQQGLIPEKLDKFVPHQIARTPRETHKMIADIIANTTAKEEVVGVLAKAQAKGQLSASLRDRRDHMLPSLQDLRLVADDLKPGTLEAVTRRLQLTPDLNQFSMRLAPVLSTYVHGMGRTFGWTSKGHGKALVQMTEAMEKSRTSTGAIQAHLMRNTYLPIALGKHTMPQAMSALQWGSMKESALRTVQRMIDTAGGKKTVLGGQLQKFQNLLLDDTNFLRTTDAGSRLAGHFYLSALGGNPSSAVLNLFQTALTTIPTIGARATGEGLKNTVTKLGKYFQLRLKGIKSDRAFQTVFPDFMEAGLAPAPITETAMRGALEEAWGQSLRIRGPAGKAIDKVKGALMTFFSGSEKLVRLTAFEGTLAKAAREGIKDPVERQAIARRVVEATQFLSGPTATPAALINLPPVLRQFSQFPLRFAEFVTGPGTTLGSGAHAVKGTNILTAPFKGRNFGTAGRVLLTSGLTAGVAREFLDADIDRALFTGAFPGPTEFGPLAPLPFRPPIVALGAGAALDIAKGEATETRRGLPLLVPGGVAAARFAGLVPGTEKVAEFLGRERADYSLVSQDGTIPVFTPQGALKGRFTPMQLFMRATGLPGSGDKQAEQEFMGQLLQNRERIREFRRQFIQAKMRNDLTTAEQLQDAHKRAFGIPIQVRPQDFEAAKERQNIVRTLRTVQSFPKDLQPQMMEAFRVFAAERMSVHVQQGADPVMLNRTSITDISRMLQSRRASGQGSPFARGPKQSSVQTLGGQLAPAAGQIR